MSGVPQHRGGVPENRVGVPMVEALLWPGDSPVDASGAVCFETLAAGMGRVRYEGRGAFYSRAQHAVIVSEAVEALARLDLIKRRVLAMHAWLADVRASCVNGTEQRSGKRRAVLCTDDVEGLADVLTCTYRWTWSPQRAANAPAGAVAFHETLVRLAELGKGDRGRLALYGLLTETVAAGLGTGTAEAALRAAGLDPLAPKAWGEGLRFVRRMAAATVTRDCRSGAGIDRRAFPALDKRIEPLAAEPAARRWLERYRVLAAGRTGAGEGRDDTTGG